MFQSVSGQGSEQGTIHYSSRPTVSQLKDVSDTISNWFESHRPQRTQIFTVTNAPFLSKLKSNGLQGTAIANLPRVTLFFQLLQNSRQHPSFSAHCVALMTKSDLIFPAFSVRFEELAAQLCSSCKFSFHKRRHFKKRHSSQVWRWRDFPGIITVLCYA